MESDNLEISTVATQNPVKGELIHLPMPQITSSTFWAVLTLDQRFRPVLILPRTTVEFKAKSNLNGDDEFELDQFTWGTRYRVNVAPGFWQYAYISSGGG